MSGRMQHLVAYADTDAGGVMYHGRYVELAERSRLLAFHQAGWSMSQLQAALNAVLLVYRLSVKFQRPARLENWLTASTCLFRHTEVQCVMRTRIEYQQTLLATLDATCVLRSDHRIVLWPPVLLHSLQLAAGSQEDASREKSIQPGNTDGRIAVPQPIRSMA